MNLIEGLQRIKKIKIVNIGLPMSMYEDTHCFCKKIQPNLRYAVL